MRQPPLLQIDRNNQNVAEGGDVDPEVQAEYSRQEARNLVRNHLDNHVGNNPGRSSDYVTWVATLHPENAEVTVDQRFFVPGNPWWRIYEDTKNNNHTVPTATAVAIDDDDDVEVGNNHNNYSGQDYNAPNSNSNGSSPSMKDTNANVQYPSLCLVCSPVDTFAGVMNLGFALMGVVLTESFALFLCYIPAFILYHIANLFSPPNVLTGLFYSFFMIFYYACALGDSICLLASVLVTEIVAACGYLVSLCTGGVLMARFWHQYIRRVCHGIRIALRNKLYFSNPTRDFLLCNSRNNQEFERQASDSRNAPVSAVVQQLPAPSTSTSGQPISAVVQHVPSEHITIKE